MHTVLAVLQPQCSAAMHSRACRVAFRGDVLWQVLALGCQHSGLEVAMPNHASMAAELQAAAPSTPINVCCCDVNGATLCCCQVEFTDADTDSRQEFESVREEVRPAGHKLAYYSL